DCSAIHATNISDGEGFVALLIMFVSRRLRLTTRPCGPISAGGSDPDRRRPKATGAAPGEFHPSATVPPNLSGGLWPEYGPNLGHRWRAFLPAPGSTRDRHRARAPRTGPSPARSGAFGSALTLVSA